MKRILAGALFLLVASHIALSQSSKDAFRSLKAIEAKVEVGISYTKYREALGDANLDLRLFLESPAAKKLPTLSISMKNALEHYKDAADLWSLTVERRRAPYYSPDAKPYLTGAALTNALFERYPAAKDQLKERHDRSQFGPEISEQDFLNIIWAAASKELKSASRSLGSGKN